MSERYRNQSGIISPMVLADVDFTIVGSGAIGGWLTMALAKMGAKKIVTYDGDKVDEHNISTQFYPELAVGVKKSEVLASIVKQYSGIDITANGRHWEPKDKVSKFVVSCVDNMTVRKQLYEATKKNGGMFIDGRMGAGVLRVYSIDTTLEHECAFYERTLYTDTEATQERCTSRSIIYTVFLVVGHMMKSIKKRILKEAGCTEYVYGVQHDRALTTVAKKEAGLSAVPESSKKEEVKAGSVAGRSAPPKEKPKFLSRT